MFGPDLPAVKYERFENPPIKAMLGQVQFPPILKLRDVEAVVPLQDEVRERFPGFVEEAQVQFQVAIAGQAQPPAQEATRTFRFTDREATWSAVLAPNALTLEAVGGAPYTSYDQFAESFRFLWAAVVKHLSPSSVTQQGLRYIDHLEGEHTGEEWAEWINPALLGSVAGDVLGSPDLRRSVSELLYANDDGQMVFRHGIAQAGPANANGYLLDFDASHTQETDTTDLDAIMGRFDESHQTLYAFFRWCVTEKALESFGRDAR